MSDQSLTSLVTTPIGPFSVLVDSGGAVLASGFTTDDNQLLSLIHPTLRPGSPPRQLADLGAVTRAVIKYFDGDFDSVAGIPVNQYSTGGLFRQAWTALRDIPPGAPLTYTAFAGLAGRPAAVRPAAQACARNAAALFVPCHRVVRGDGSLGGYRWGIGVKQWLLSHEKAGSPTRTLPEFSIVEDQ